MLKSACCCSCIRRKSKATVSPNTNGVAAESRCGSLLIQTAPGRFISVTVLAGKSQDPNLTVPPSSSRRQRNGRPPSAISHKSADEGGKSALEKSKLNEDTDQESDIEGKEQTKTVVVTVDIERPKTGDTIASRVSLPPLRSGSPVIAGGKVKNLKWNLRRRFVGDAKPVEEPRLPKSISASSISTTMFGTDCEESQVAAEYKKEFKKRGSVVHGNQDFWQDEIVTLPGTAETERTPDSGCVMEEQSPDLHGIARASTVLFFIHGVGGNSKIWINQVKYFRELGYNVIAIDLIGHGNSSAPRAKSAYLFESIKSDILSLFDRFARDRNVIIAHSYGTCFAAMLARERREKVSHLVLISSGAPLPLDSDDGAFALPTALLSLLRVALNRKFMKFAFISKPTLDVFKSSFGGVKTGVLKRTMQGQRWSDCTYLYHQQIHAPTLLIYGSGDGLVSLDEMHEMRKAIPGAVLEVVDQAAHMVMLEQPEHVNRLIQEFLRKAETVEEEPDEEKSDADHTFYKEKRRLSRPVTSRTIPPSNVFRIHGHDSVIIMNTRTVAVS